MSLKLEFVISMIDRATRPVAAVSKGIDNMLKPAREVRASLNNLMAAARFDNLRRSVAEVGTAFDGVMSAARGVAGVVAAVAATAGAAFFGFKRVVDQVDGVNDLAQKLGITTQRLQEMGFAAQMSGSNQEELGQGLMFLNKNLAEARAGSAEMVQAFADVGITQRDLKNAAFTAADAYERTADTFQRAAATGKDAAAMTRVSMALLGRAGAQQIQALSQGSAKMREYYAEARRLGIVLSSGTVKAMADFNDQFDTAKLVTFGALATALAGIAPRIQAVVQRFTDLVVANREVIGTGLAGWFERMEQALPRLLVVVGGLSAGLGTLFELADKVAQALGGWENVMYVLAGGAVLKLGVAVWSLGAALWGLSGATAASVMALAPLLAMVVAIGVALYVVYKAISGNWADISETFSTMTQKVQGFISQVAGSGSAMDKLIPDFARVPDYPGAIAPRGGMGGRSEVGGTLTIAVEDRRTTVTQLKKAPGGVLDLDVYNGRPGVAGP